MGLGVTMPAPHGGISVVLLSNKSLLFLACIVLGTVVTAAIEHVIKLDYDERVGNV